MGSKILSRDILSSVIRSKAVADKDFGIPYAITFEAHLFRSKVLLSTCAKIEGS